MNVLVTGGAGYIGSVVTRALLGQGHKVLVVDDLSTGFRANVPTKAEFRALDVRNFPALTEAFAEFRPQTVIHLAGKLIVQESKRDPISYFSVNVEGGLNVLRACQAHGVKQFVFSSTAAVYGDAPQVPVHENAPVQPLTPYGHSKAMFEQMLMDFAPTADMRYVILRYFNVAGAAKDLSVGPRGVNTTNLVRVVAQAASGLRSKVEVFGTDYGTRDGSAVRDFIHVEDLAKAHVAAVDHLADGGRSEVLNCGYGRGITVLELIESFKRLSSREFEVVTVDRREGDIAESIASVSRLQQVLNWTPEFDALESICASALAWERKNSAPDVSN